MSYYFRFEANKRTTCEKKLIVALVVCALAIISLVIALAVTAGKDSDTTPDTSTGNIITDT